MFTLPVSPVKVHEEAPGPLKINADGTIQAQTYDEVRWRGGISTHTYIYIDICATIARRHDVTCASAN